jgi:hypothetical protein
MSLTDIAALISSVGIIVTAIIATATFVRTWTLEKRLGAIKVQATATHELVNSQSAALLAATGKAAYKEGKTEGRLGRLENESDHTSNGGKT